MSSAQVTEHYRTLLAPLYAWMMGGMDAAIARGESEVRDFGPPRSAAAVAIDLGAGFGMHAIPLARAGWRVTAIDTSAYLLSELRRAAPGPRLRTVEADLIDFRAHSPANAELILCLGDTLTHLPDATTVSRLMRDVAQALAPGGRFIATFRDYSAPPGRALRFIPVRSDADRIHTCVLEQGEERVIVHDLVYQRVGGAWEMHVSHYGKLRIDAHSLRTECQELGLLTTSREGPGGMVQLIASRPSA